MTARPDLTGPLAAWSGLELSEPLAGCARNPVWLAHRHGRRLVVRRSGRSAASLEWELDLLAHLAGHGIGVPAVVPADDGRRHVAGVVVQEFAEGRPPRDSADWRDAVAALRAVHAVTAGWPQRPGFTSSAALLATDRGGDVRLDLLPAGGAEAVRTAWRPLLAAAGPDGRAECVVHADVGANNLLVDRDRVTLLDWDEARVDVPWFDFAFVPDEVAVPTPVPRSALVTAGVAWEAATCWAPEPGYAARRLAELHTRLNPADPADPTDPAI